MLTHLHSGEDYPYSKRPNSLVKPPLAIWEEAAGGVKYETSLAIGDILSFLAALPRNRQRWLRVILSRPKQMRSCCIILAGILTAAMALPQRLGPRETPPATAPGFGEPARKLPPLLTSINPPAAALPALSQSERIRRKRGSLVQTGIRRNLAVDELGQALRGVMPDGRVLWSVALRSPEAIGMRVHFSNFDLGSNDEVWLYAPGGTHAAGPYSGKGPLGDGDFWSASVASDTVVVAVLAEAGAGGEYSPRFSIDAVAHQWATAVMPDQPAPAAAPASCNLDVTCYPTYQTVSRAVVQYDF